MPLRAVTPERSRQRCSIFVSTHAALAGGDDGFAAAFPRIIVSIHAALAGGDLWAGACDGA